MRAYAIVIKDAEISELGYERLVESSQRVGNTFNIHKFEAITPEFVDKTLTANFIKWNYPWEGSVTDFASGLVKSAYTTADPRKRIACALSHYLLWKTAAKEKEPILVLEHDAAFTSKLDFNPDQAPYDIIGINNPLGATRKSQVYYNKILQSQMMFQPTPLIDDHTVPQGLAGNSAYIIKPTGAEQMLKLVKEYGLWPNDALMCRQLVRKLGVTRKFYTAIQNLKSTTTL